MSKLVELQVELLDKTCVTCPLISLKSELIEYGDMSRLETYAVHKCEHLDFCEHILRNKKENK